MNTVQSYPLGGSVTERDRLLRQAKDYEPQATWLLDQVGVQNGWRVADIGCGPIGILNLLSKRVGPEGSVVGVEREPRFVEMARSDIRERGLTNVSIVQADALNTGLEKGTFDLVHERLVMVNVSAREAFLTEMLSLLRPGGTIILADIDNVSWVCDPPHASWNILLDAFHGAFHAGGGDGFIGRRLPRLLKEAGVRGVNIQTTVVTPDAGDYRRTHLVALINSVKDKIVAMGGLTEAALIEHRDALLAHLNNPATTVVDKLFVQAWGRKNG
jgi:SAM-dependent methyltransferase